MNADSNIRLPSDMDPFTSASRFCTGFTVYKALKVSESQTGEWVSIEGIGGLGQYDFFYKVRLRKLNHIFQDLLA